MDHEFAGGFLIAAVVFSFIGILFLPLIGKRWGYADGCHDGSRGHSQVIEIDGKRRCLPHADAVRLRKP
jgi:hypothetical protein